MRPELAKLQANTNPHPLPKFRANGPLSNMAEFAKAFGCTRGEPMVRAEACKIWWRREDGLRYCRHISEVIVSGLNPAV